MGTVWSAAVAVAADEQAESLVQKRPGGEERVRGGSGFQYEELGK